MIYTLLLLQIVGKLDPNTSILDFTSDIFKLGNWKTNEHANLIT